MTYILHLSVYCDGVMFFFSFVPFPSANVKHSKSSKSPRLVNDPFSSNGSVELKQSWFLADGSKEPNDDAKVWFCPIILGTDKGEAPVSFLDPWLWQFPFFFVLWYWLPIWNVVIEGPEEGERFLDFFLVVFSHKRQGTEDWKGWMQPLRSLLSQIEFWTTPPSPSPLSRKCLQTIGAESETTPSRGSDRTAISYLIVWRCI